MYRRTQPLAQAIGIDPLGLLAKLLGYSLPEEFVS